MKRTTCLILGGGKGTRLFPLTEKRSKPAVPLGGKYRLIDIPIANCINSGMNRVYVLTQFNSVSLHRHIRQAYNFDQFHGGFVEILAAQQTLADSHWYQGTADAVRQNLRYLEQPGIDYVLILSGDQLYRMDYREMIRTHEESSADVTIGALPLASKDAAAFGIMRLDDTGRVEGFLEKPTTEEDLKVVRTDPAWIDAHGVESRGRDCLASMGIYLFNRETLVDLLEKTDYEDFGREVFPTAIRSRHVQVHLFDGYWEDIGTIGAFYEANLALTDRNPPFDFTNPNSPIYTRPRFLPSSRIDDANVKHSLIADGCLIDSGAVIENSIIGLRCRIGKDVVIRDSVLMGNDFHPTAEMIEADQAEGRPSIGIGDGAVIEKAIVDKNCRIAEGVEVRFDCNCDAEGVCDPVIVRDGIAVIPKGATLPGDWKCGTLRPLED